MTSTDGMFGQGGRRTLLGLGAVALCLSLFLALGAGTSHASETILKRVVGSGAFDPSPVYTGQPATSVAVAPSDIAVEPDGSILVAMQMYNQVVRVENGTVTTVFGTGAEPTTDNIITGDADETPVRGPMSISLTPDGGFLVASPGGGPDWVGSVWKVLGGTATRLATVPDVRRVASDPDGGFYAAGGNGPGDILHFDASLNQTTALSDPTLGPDGVRDLLGLPGGEFLFATDEGGVRDQNDDPIDTSGGGSVEGAAQLSRMANGDVLVAGIGPGSVAFVSSWDGSSVTHLMGSESGYLQNFCTDGAGVKHANFSITGAAEGPGGALFAASHDAVFEFVEGVTTIGPQAQMSGPEVVKTGSGATFTVESNDYVGLTPCGYGPATFAWDLDGNGSFELDRGTDGTPVTTTYATAGVRSVKLRVTNSAGNTAIATHPVDVRLASPAGEPGVSINGGDIFTNDPEVSLSLRWPELTTDFLASNDGGFGGAAAAPVGAAVPWTLNSSGAERLPKTVYVRFAGGSAGAETYTDDIILDQTAPSLGRASARLMRAGNKLRLTIKASDSVSGLHRMQVTGKKSRPGTARPFRARVRNLPYRQVTFVRVSDHAGNVSRWKRVTAPPRHNRPG